MFLVILIEHADLQTSIGSDFALIVLANIQQPIDAALLTHGFLHARAGLYGRMRHGGYIGGRRKVG